jgi:acyl-CoA reductase-like NAD-dependent aldehyde dehydrogenase
MTATAPPIATEHITYDSFFIGGDWRKPEGTGTIRLVSASTEEEIGLVPEGTEADIDAAVLAARRAFDDPQGWSQWSPAERLEVLDRFAAALDGRGQEIARRVTGQNGMPWALSSTVEAVFPGLLLRYYGELARNQEREEHRPGMLGGVTIVRRDPVGVVGAIVPWNVPVALTFMKVAPALAAGCTVVLKPAPETVLEQYVVAEAALEAGLPAGVLNIVQGGREVGAHLVSHPQVDKIAFTGSTAAGRVIAAECGRLLRPVSLELGGKSAAIVLDDATLEKSVEQLFGATLFNSGQTCWLNSRILAPASRYDDVLDVVGGLLGGVTVGDPFDPATQVGPMTSARQRDRVEGYIAKGRSEGARLVTGGGRPEHLDRGWFVQPTLFADVAPDATIAREEIFGPVLSVIPYGTVDEAIAIANSSEFGLGGSVWTNDHERGIEVARRMQSGTIGINHYANEPNAPFGGVKSSGLGRELGPEGMTAYQVLKSIYLDPAVVGANAPQ